jgi:mRNA-degrading endonuclease RelE of RelBE toxin-antitoxin system
MAYRILIEPAAARRLRTFLPHVVQRLGRLLAELAELSGADSHPALGLALLPAPPVGLLTLEAEGVSVLYRIDKTAETLTLVEAEEREEAVASSATTDVAAAS